MFVGILWETDMFFQFLLKRLQRTPHSLVFLRVLPSELGQFLLKSPDSFLNPSHPLVHNGLYFLSQRCVLFPFRLVAHISAPAVDWDYMVESAVRG